MFIRDAILAGLLVPLSVSGPAALAQTPPPPARSAPDATVARADQAVIDPAAPVPAVLYRSVFVDTPAGVETEESDWKRANAEVGQFKRGHVDILQWENRKEGKP